MRPQLAPFSIAAVLMVVWGTCSTVMAEEPLTVDEAVRAALSQHPSVRAAAARVDQADAAHRAVWETYAPQLSVFGGVQRNDVTGSTTTTTTGAGLLVPPATVVQNFSQSDTRILSGVNVEEFLFDFGGVGSQRRSTDAARGAHLSALETQRLDVTLNVKESYYGLLRANRLVLYNRQTVERNERRAAEIGQAVATGQRPSKDLLQTDVDLANAKLNFSRSESEYTGMEARFLESIGRRERLTRKLVDDVSLKPLSLTLEQATQRARSGRPELQQSQAMIDAQEAQIGVIRASYLPRVSAFLGLSNLNGVGSSDLDRLTVFTGGVQVGIPTSWAFSNARLDQAEAALAELKARRMELEQSIAVGVSRSYTALFEGVERIRITQELAGKAEANWQQTQERYGKRRATILEATDAYNFLYDARVSLIQALYEAKIAEARLERAVGETF